MSELKKVEPKRSVLAIVFVIICTAHSIISLFSTLMTDRMNLAKSVQYSIIFLFLAQLLWCLEPWIEKSKDLQDKMGFRKRLFGIKWRLVEFRKRIRTNWFWLVKLIFGVIFLIIFFYGFGINEADADSVLEAIFLFVAYILSVFFLIVSYIISFVISNPSEKKNKKTTTELMT